MRELIWKHQKKVKRFPIFLKKGANGLNRSFTKENMSAQEANAKTHNLTSYQEDAN